MLQVGVTLTGPAPAGGVNLVTQVFTRNPFDGRAGPPELTLKFTIPSVRVAAGNGFTNFTMIYNGGAGGPVGAQNGCVLSVEVPGGTPQTARFTVQ